MPDVPLVPKPEVSEFPDVVASTSEQAHLTAIFNGAVFMVVKRSQSLLEAHAQVDREVLSGGSVS